MLSEMGAEVLRIERAGSTRPFLTLPDEYDIDRHGRSVLRIDLKHLEGAELVLRLAEKADMLIEGFRPDVMEQLGLGSAAVLARNSALIYGRTTGFGQNGPLSDRAGHDITYLAYSGVLHAIGQEGGRPVPPLNLVADYGGGAVMLVPAHWPPCLGASMLTTLCTPIESGRRHGTTGTVSLLRPTLVLHRFCPCGKPGIIPTMALATPF